MGSHERLDNADERESFVEPEIVESSELCQRWLRSGTRLWFLTAVCFLLAIALTWWSMGSSGIEVLVQFENGYNIRAGDSLRHRGIEVGRVQSVLLRPDLSGVDVTVLLEEQAASLARQGSQFWIVRPQFSLSRLRGLETVVGARYMAVLPGPADAPRKSRFVGSETPLTIREPGSQEITVRFPQGFGLSPGDHVRYRDMTVGEVTDVQLVDDVSAVQVSLRLVASARPLARAGTQFWVERPRLSVQEIRGLDTLVGGRYVAMIPGPATAELQTEFIGLATAPTGELPEGGLEIVLYGPKLRGLARGVPLGYRGVRVGHVVSVGLARDATEVEARVFVDPAYRELVRRNSVFWNDSGFDISVGITGVQMSTDTLSSVTVGGIAFATPDPPGELASTGTRFPVHVGSKEEWLSWHPSLHVGDRLLPPGARLPELTRATVQWRQRQLGFRRTRQRHGWVIALENNRLLGLSALLGIPSRAIQGETTIALAGEQFSMATKKIETHGDLTVVQLPSTVKELNRFAWRQSQIRRPEKPEACLLVADPSERPFPLAAGRLQSAKNGWIVDASISLDEDWAGAAVVALDDGKILGLADIEEGRVRIRWVWR